MAINFRAKMSRDEVAKALGVSPTRVSQLRLSGASVATVFKHMRQRILEAETAGDKELRETRLQRERLRLAKEDGKVIDLSEAMEVNAIIAGMARAAIEALPARFSRDVRERARLEALCDKTLEEMVARLKVLEQETPGPAAGCIPDLARPPAEPVGARPAPGLSE